MSSSIVSRAPARALAVASAGRMKNATSAVNSIGRMRRLCVPLNATRPRSNDPDAATSASEINTAPLPVPSAGTGPGAWSTLRCALATSPSAISEVCFCSMPANMGLRMHDRADGDHRTQRLERVRLERSLERVEARVDGACRLVPQRRDLPAQRRRGVADGGGTPRLKVGKGLRLLRPQLLGQGVVRGL